MHGRQSLGNRNRRKLIDVKLFWRHQKIQPVVVAKPDEHTVKLPAHLTKVSTPDKDIVDYLHQSSQKVVVLRERHIRLPEEYYE